MTTTATDDPLRLTLCPTCGYSLEGLGDDARCPECGVLPDRDTVVLHGWAAGSHADISSARPWVAAFIGGSWLVWVLWTAFIDHMRPDSLVWVGALIAWLAWLLWRRWNSHLPAPTQVRLSRDGFCQVNMTKSRPMVRIQPWAGTWEVTVQPQWNDLARITIRSRPPWWRMTYYPVDAVVRCTLEQARALRERVALWRNPTDMPQSPPARLEVGAGRWNNPPVVQREPTHVMD